MMVKHSHVVAAGFAKLRIQCHMRKIFNRKGILAPAALTCSLALTALAAPTSTQTDQVFVSKVSQGGAYEVAASKFAEQHASMPDVKDQAITEVHDHTLVGDELKRIATSAGISIAPQLNPEFSERLARLKASVGPGFDAFYIEDMKSIHANDEKLFAQEAVDGSTSFKTFAHQTDLIVKRHIGALHGTDQ